MEKRDFVEMVAFFNRKVSEMDIARKYKMELLGMVTAIEIKHDQLMQKWTPVTVALPEEDEEVLVTVRFEGLKDMKSSTYVEVASQTDGEWSAYTDEYKVMRHRHHVIAWMPLPEPWKGDR